MSDLSRRVNSIVVKNLPPEFTTERLCGLFSHCGQVISSKILPPNSNYNGGYGFVNFADAKSCDQAVEQMENYMLDGFTIRVNHAKPRPGNNMPDRPHNEFRASGESNGRAISATNMHLDESNSISSPGTPSRVNGFRPSSERPSSHTQPKPMPTYSSQLSSNESDTLPNTRRSPWDGAVEQQSQDTVSGRSPLANGSADVHSSMIIQEHTPLAKNQTQSIYLSNLEAPNVVFAATLDDYVNATLLITQMNKHEQLAKVQVNSFKTKLSVGQPCAALFNKDWYRARVLEVADSRVRVQYIDWGNTGWCDPVLEIRSLPSVYYKDPALCVKCLLDGVPPMEKLADEQKNAILGILILDVKLEMTVLRTENNLPCVRLNLGERNLNNEVRATFPSSTALRPVSTITFDSHRPEINLAESHYVQLTAVDVDSECFHVLLMRDCLTTIMNTLKDWKAGKQPLAGRPTPNTLVCAQYDADDLWYRAWIKSVTNDDACVYFVDFGNEEMVPNDRLSECPDVLKSIPWQSVQIKLAGISLSDEERCVLLRDFETLRLEMRINRENQNMYVVDLMNNGRSLVDHVLELRKKEPKQSPQIKPKTNQLSSVLPTPTSQTPTKLSTAVPQTTIETDPPVVQENSRHQTPSSVQPTANSTRQPTQCDREKMLQPINTPVATADTPKQPLFSSADTVTNESSVSEASSDTALNDSVSTLITEQRRQNRLLEQVIAAINTTNALLTQLVQR